jgi:hypothetical protein
MTGIDDDRPELSERLAADAELLKSAWEETIDDMTAMADARREQGWDVLAVPAVDVIPEHQDVGDTDRYGLAFVIPEKSVHEFEDTFRRGSYPKYEVYRSTVEDRVFLVVEYLDPDVENVILVGGAYEIRNAYEMVEDAIDKEEFFTHHQEIDGTHLGTFHHDSHEKFVPADGLPDRAVEDAGDE